MFGFLTRCLKAIAFTLKTNEFQELCKQHTHTFFSFIQNTRSFLASKIHVLLFRISGKHTRSSLSNFRNPYVLLFFQISGIHTCSSLLSKIMKKTRRRFSFCFIKLIIYLFFLFVFCLRNIILVLTYVTYYTRHYLSDF